MVGRAERRKYELMNESYESRYTKWALNYDIESALFWMITTTHRCLSSKAYKFKYYKQVSPNKEILNTIRSWNTTVKYEQKWAGP